MSLRMDVNTSGLRRVIRQSPQRVDSWLRGVAESMVSDIKVSMGTSPDGERYKRGRRYHVASVAGYPPNVDMGTLWASIRWVPDGRLRYRIVDGVNYGIYLEDGTANIAPRPFMRPVFEAWRRGILQDARTHLDLE